MFGRPISLASEQRLMILPRRRVFMPGITARATKNGPSRLAAMSARQSSSLKLSSGPRLLIAALLTRISIGASRSSAATAAATAAACVTSNGATSTRQPSRASSAAAVSSLPRWRPLMTTRAPASANPRAMANPSPEPPPVTSARRPVRSNGFARGTICAPHPNPLPARGEHVQLSQPEHVLHVEQALRPFGSLRRDEARRAQRALSEVRARTGPVRQLQALAGAGKDHAMVADNIAAARRGKADRARLAFAGDAVAAEYAVVLQVASQRLRCRVAQ